MARITLGFKTLATQAVAAAGTAQPLDGGAPATPNLVRQVVVQWNDGNTGDVYIGESDVAAGKCIVLNASNPTFSFQAEDTVADEDNCFVDMNSIYIDAANTGDTVRVAYMSLEDKAYNS